MFWNVIDLGCMLGELLSATGHTYRGFLKTFGCVNSWNVCLQLLLVLEILYDKVGVNYVRKIVLQHREKVGEGGREFYWS